MKWLNDDRIRLVIIGFGLAILIVGIRNVKADFTFSEPIHLGPPINTSSHDAEPHISADGLQLYFASDRPGGQGSGDIWVSMRQNTDDDWGSPENLGVTINSSANEAEPCISTNGLELFFCSNRPGGSGNMDLYVATRDTIHHAWNQPVNLGSSVNTSSADYGPSLSSDGLTLYFDSNRSGGNGTVDIWVTTRATIDDPWMEAGNLGSTVNTEAREISPCISADGLWLLFRSYGRGSGQGNCDLWLSTRATPTDPWGIPVNLGPPVNSRGCEHEPSLSADGLTLFFGSNDRPGQFGGEDLWQATIIPIVDLNQDGIVDAVDMCIMVYNWDTDNSACDIGPMPWGDGIVDIEDLKVLAEHLFEDQRLIAHWMLDEEAGDIAYDTIGEYHGVLQGEPIWQPDGGMIAGALQFDGIDDCVTIDAVLNPADGEFSVFAWIKGGAPGQVILSQENGANWLSLDSVEGCLMTELEGAGRSSGGPVLSEVNITDGTWHEIALVWDGSCRCLYVDGTEVARDGTRLSGLKGANGGLYFGVGSTMTDATFFSGLIDDIRIYNRVVSP